MCPLRYPICASPGHMRNICPGRQKIGHIFDVASSVTAESYSVCGVIRKGRITHSVSQGVKKSILWGKTHTRHRDKARRGVFRPVLSRGFWGRVDSGDGGNGGGGNPGQGVEAENLGDDSLPLVLAGVMEGAVYAHGPDESPCNLALGIPVPFHPCPPRVQGGGGVLPLGVAVSVL